MKLDFNILPTPTHAIGIPGFFLTKIEKTQGGKNFLNSITQDNLSQKTQRTGSNFWVAQKTQ